MLWTAGMIAGATFVTTLIAGGPPWAAVSFALIAFIQFATFLAITSEGE